VPLTYNDQCGNNFVDNPDKFNSTDFQATFDELCLGRSTCNMTVGYDLLADFGNCSSFKPTAIDPNSTSN